jgi:hypothetical protein
METSFRFLCFATTVPLNEREKDGQIYNMER